MKYVKWLIPVALGYFFYVMNPITGNLWPKTGFAFIPDCVAAQAAVKAAIPTPTPGQQPNLIVIPGCYSSATQDEAR